MGTFGPAIFGLILLLYRGCPLLVKLHRHGPVGTTEFVRYMKAKLYCVLIRSNLLERFNRIAILTYVAQLMSLVFWHTCLLNY